MAKNASLMNPIDKAAVVAAVVALVAEVTTISLTILEIFIVNLVSAHQAVALK